MKRNVIASLVWKLLERVGTQGIQFIVQIFLARLLLPEEYGIIAMVTVFITLANVFVESGFNTALIQKKDADEIDFSSVFYLSLVVASGLYIIIYFLSPTIAIFYDQPLLTSVLRVLSLTLFIGVFNSIQNAYISRHMMFKKLFASSSIAMIISGMVGIGFAYLGFGVWALVAQQLTNQLVILFVLWFSVKWRPRLIFSFTRIRSLFSYGSKLLLSSLIDTLYNNLRTLFIGRMYTASTLGFYNRGQQFPQMIVSSINGSIQSVMLPALSAYQDDKAKVKNMMRRAIVTSSYLIFPMMVGMAAVAEPLIEVLLTAKWLEAAPFLRILCFSYALWPIHTANLQAINALGRSDIFLKLEVVKKIVGLIILAISLPFGVYAIAVGQVVSGVISTFINAYPNRQLLNYSYIEQWQDILPSLLISLTMGGIVNLFNFLNMTAWKILLIQIIVGLLIYVGLSIIFKLESFQYLLAMIKQLKANKKGRKT